MNIKSMVTIDSCIKELELALQVDGKDYEEQKFENIMQSIKNRINRQYQIDLTLGKVNEVAYETAIYKRSMSLFMGNVARICANICLLGQTYRYETSTPISLSSINYMGFLPEDMREVLIALQKEKTMASCENPIKDIELKLISIRICYEKRLFMLVCICYELGFYEVCASIAEILYLGAKYNS